MKNADLGCVNLSMWDVRSGGLNWEGAWQVPGQEGRVRYGCGFIESGILIYVTGEIDSLSPSKVMTEIWSWETKSRCEI